MIVRGHARRLTLVLRALALTYGFGALVAVMLPALFMCGFLQGELFPSFIATLFLVGAENPDIVALTVSRITSTSATKAVQSVGRLSQSRPSASAAPTTRLGFNQKASAERGF